MSLKTKRIYEFGAFRLDAVEKLLFQNGEYVPLAPKVIETLIALVENNGRLVEKEELIKRVWPDTYVEDNNLDKNISTLRKVLLKGHDEQKFIETVKKRGYRFVADVKSIDEETELVEDEAELIIDHTKVRVRIEEEVENSQEQRAVELPAQAKDHKALLMTGESSPQAKSRRRRFISFAMVAALIIATITGSWLILRKLNRSSGNGSAQASASAPSKTIAVLPFQPISAKNRDEFLELGMADALITKLSSLEHVVVRPTSAVRKYADLNQDPLVAGKEQKVDAVLVGNVQKISDTLRVTVQLINVEDGRPLWAEKFDAKFTDIFAVQDAISDKITNALALQITGDERARLAKRYTQNDEAYELFQKGRYFSEINTEESIRKAISYFEQATEKDPNYALAFAWIAGSYVSLSSRIGRIGEEDIARAKSACARAIALDDTLAEPHHALGGIRLVYDRDWQSAEREYKLAIQLNPNDADAHQSYSGYLLAAGRLEEGLAESKHSVELYPLSAQNNLNLTLAFLSLRRFDEAIAQLNKTAELNLPYATVQLMLGRIYIVEGKYEEAIAQYQKALNAGGDRRTALVGLAQGYALTGRRDEAQKAFDELLAQQKEHPVQHYFIAIVQTALGQRDAAIESLEKSVAAHEEGVLFLKVESRLDPLRSDPRFIDLMRKVGIPG